MPNKNKSISYKANSIATAWATLAKDDTFGGHTLTQFQQLLEDAHNKSANLATLNVSYTDAMKQRDAAHEALSQAMLNVVDGVKGDTNKHGANSSLYKAMGYVPRNERASGLTRKGSPSAAKSSRTGSSTAPATATNGKDLTWEQITDTWDSITGTWDNPGKAAATTTTTPPTATPPTTNTGSATS
jgi:hypothetical protein